MWLLQNNKYVDIHLPGWAVCVLIIRLISNIHQHRFACMLTSTKAFLYEVAFCSPFKTGNRSSGCWLLRKEVIFLGEVMLCVHTVVSSCLVCLRAAQTIHLLVVNLMAQYWRSAKEQNTSLWCQRDSFPDFMRHRYILRTNPYGRFRLPNSLSNRALSTIKQRHEFRSKGNFDWLSVSLVSVCWLWLNFVWNFNGFKWQMATPLSIMSKYKGCQVHTRFRLDGGFVPLG